MASLQGKSAIVTGAARGIGKSIALALAGAGMDVLVCARSDVNDPAMPGTIGQSAEEISALGRRGVALRVDLSLDADVRTMVEFALSEFGRIDVLVNNAAYVAEGSFLGAALSELDNSYVLNVHAAYLASQLVAPVMQRGGGGAIFNVTSGAARHASASSAQARSQMAFQLHPGYGITKAALDRMSTAVAGELGELGVGIVAINPGFTLTERLRSMMGPDADLSMAESPETTAKAITFMAQDPMSFTGTVVDARDIVDAHGL